MKQYQQLTKNIHFASERIRGKRQYQEDDFAIDYDDPSDFLMVLADGMGGEIGGATASETTVQTFMQVYSKTRNSSLSVPERLQQSLDKSNEALSSKIDENPKLDGMGCTLIAVAINFNQALLHWISVGDSPLWVLQSGKFRRLNADHSMRTVLEARVKEGTLSQKEADIHPERNMLRSALVGYEIELIDASTHETLLDEGDQILLASDGLLTLSTEEIFQLLATHKSPKNAVEALINAVCDKDAKGQDNTTVLAATLISEETTTERNTATE